MLEVIELDGNGLSGNEVALRDDIELSGSDVALEDDIELRDNVSLSEVLGSISAYSAIGAAVSILSDLISNRSTNSSSGTIRSRS